MSRKKNVVKDELYTNEDVMKFKSIFGKRTVNENEVEIIKYLYNKYVKERKNFGECSTCSNNLAGAWNELKNIFVIGAKDRGIDLR